MPPGLQPAHKMSIILFLERVYGIPDQETFFRLIEDAFLPDIRSCYNSRYGKSIFIIFLKKNEIIFHRQQLRKVIWHLH